MAAKKSQPSMPKGKAANTLYVVLHGLISLIDIGADGFIAYVVDIGAEHKYLYGNWLTESDIPKKEEGGPPLYATLLGVEKGHSDIDCKKNAVLKVSRLPDEKRTRAVIQFPKPDKIYHRLQGEILKKKFPFAGDTKHLADTPTHISNIRVLSYSFKDSEEVCLTAQDGSLWQCPAKLAVSGSFTGAVLHIYNEPDHFLDGDGTHNRHEFNVTAEILGSDLVLASGTAIVKDESKLEPIQGLLPGELVFLSQRGDAVLNILNAARGKSKGPAVEVGSGAGQICGGLNARLTPNIPAL